MHDKTYNKTCATSEDSDQPAHPRSLIRVLTDRMCLLLSPGYPKRNKQEPLPYWVGDSLSLCWSRRSYCRFCRALSHMIKTNQTPFLTEMHLSKELRRKSPFDINGLNYWLEAQEGQKSLTWIRMIMICYTVPWWPSWLSDQIVISSSESACCLDAYVPEQLNLT